MFRRSLKKFLYWLSGADKEIDGLRLMLKTISEPEILESHWKPETASVIMQSPFFTNIAITFYTLLEKTNAQNYLEVYMQYKDVPFTILVQKPCGKTPHQMRELAEARVRELESQLKQGESL